MKILKIIHGYPPFYNAGSEVYSQMLCLGLAKNHEVYVFTREENPFADDFSMRVTYDNLNPKIKLHLINIPGEKYRYRYQHDKVDQHLDKLLYEIKPDIVHIGHLNHLSVTLINEIVKHKIPILYTLHDYWLMCPRGQFIQRNSLGSSGLYALCDSQENKKCATQCYSGYFSGAESDVPIDIAYWANWVERRMALIQNAVSFIDYFIAPSQYLYQRFVKDFKISTQKICYLDYGFDLNRLQGRNRIKDEPFTFGYIGTHIPAKGIQHLIAAFGMLKGDCQLRIWGRPRPQNTEGLKALASTLDKTIQARIEWLPEYRNEQIVADVFNKVDCIVVPSIWVENSPLVIHEALQMRIPVITAHAGGMAEYVQHEKNGLLFEHRNVASLAEQMQTLVDDPKWAQALGAQGYLNSQTGDIPNLQDHVQQIENIYETLLLNVSSHHSSTHKELYI